MAKIDWGGILSDILNKTGQAVGDAIANEIRNRQNKIAQGTTGSTDVKRIMGGNTILYLAGIVVGGIVLFRVLK